MSYPPPHDPNAPGYQNAGGGFGPPPGYGPPEQPGGYGPGPHVPGQGGYGYPPPGGPGMPPPPPPAGGGNGAKVAGIIIGAVVVGALIVGGVLIFGGSDDESDKAETANTPSASADITTPSPDTSDSAAPSLSAKPTQSEVPYVVLDPGQCFDHPSLSSAVSSVTKRSCGTPHNGEVITNQKITGSYASEAALQKKVLESCQADASERLKTIPQDGTQYYYYAIYPALATYQRGAGDTISCALTLSNEQDGPKLDKPLPK